jgi:Uma2 family endonuclease
MPRLTLAQFMGRPETKPASEYVCGEVYQKPMPDLPHSRLQGFLTHILYLFLAETGLGEALPEFRCIFGPPGGERTYVPDVVYVAKENLPSERHLHRAPDLAIEILSPDQHWSEFVDKIQFYLLYGVQLVWVIDPANATIAVQAPGREGRILGAGDVLDGGEVLPGFSVPVDDILARIQV